MYKVFCFQGVNKPAYTDNDALTMVRESIEGLNNEGYFYHSQFSVGDYTFVSFKKESE